MRRILALRRPGRALATLAVLGALVLPKHTHAQSRLAPFGIARGADGNVWFTETATDTIGRITTSGRVTEFRI